MSRKATRRPTDAELEILRILWDRGPSSVRDVHIAVRETREHHYNSVLKTLQIMVEKGLASRDDSVRPQVYRASSGRAITERHLLRDLLERVFGGSVVELVMRAASTKHASPEEIREIRERLRKLEDER